MADQFEMISPFEPAQIRVGEDNRKLISYGTSSMDMMLDVLMNLKFLQI